MKIKLLYVLPAFTFGGTVFSTLNMIMMLDKEKYDICVLPMSYQGPVKDRYKGINILPEQILLSALRGRIGNEDIIYRKVFFFIIKAFVNISRKLHFDVTDSIYGKKKKKIQEKYNFDIVASCQEGDSTYFVSHFSNVKKIAWFRSEYQVYRHQLSPAKLAYEQQLYPCFDNIVCVSKITRDDFVQFFPSIADRVLDIHNIQNVENIIEKSREEVPDDFKKDIFNIVNR